MRKNRLGAFLLFAAVLPVWAETALIYTNWGYVTEAPMIDAVSFVNYGTFDITTSPLPFDTENTLNFTNRGTMLGAVGYRFAYNIDWRAANFVNEGTIAASESGGVIIIGPNSQTYSYTSPYAQLLVNASNIFCPGSMSAGPYGLIRMSGGKVNLSGTPMLTAVSATQQGIYSTSLDSVNRTNYLNENKITDYYWGVGTNGVFGGDPFPLTLPGRFTTNFAYSGSHQVRTYQNYTNIENIYIQQFKVFAFTNSISPSNKFVQVVFVSTNFAESNLLVDARFYPNGGSAGRGAAAVVQFATPDVDVVTGLPFTNFLYFSDNSALATAGTNVLSEQANYTGRSRRPNCYDVTYYTPIEWTYGLEANVPFDSALLYNSSYTNSIVTNSYAAYSVGIGPSGLPDIYSYYTYYNTYNAHMDPSNSLGRVEIDAGELDIDGARMRTDGLLSIVATNFVHPPNGAKLDAQQISLHLTSTNQTFVLSNMLAGNVQRLAGTLSAWSGIWTNETGGGDVDKFHVLLLDNALTTTQPSTAYGLTLRATNHSVNQVVLEDDVTIARGLLIDAENVVIRGNLTVPDSVGYTNLPRTINFTNEGDCSIAGLGNFTGQTNRYENFVNRSNLFAYGLFINAAYFENDGYLYAASGPVTINNSPGRTTMTNGMIRANNDFILATDEWVTSNATVMAGSVYTNYESGIPTYIPGTLLLHIGIGMTNWGSNDFWTVINGFQLRKTRPGSWSGSLLGTKIVSLSRPGYTTPHVWTAEDRGADRAGFADNAAVGVLALDGGATGLFQFSAHSPATNSAIYVDYLELLNNATNLNNPTNSALKVDSNFTIYFANSGPIPPSKLDGRLGGRLRWVKNFAGPNSSTNVFLRIGGTITVNRALVEDDQIDSDGDGIVNNVDPFPFDGPALTSNLTTPPWQFALQWNAASNTTYFVDVATNLSAVNPWMRLTNVAVGGIAGPVTVWDLPPEGGQRYYRVLFVP